MKAMRHLRIVLALLFGLAMVGPETHACPIHSAAPAHHQGSHQHSKAGCTCPQACCPAAAPAALPATASVWNAAPRQVRVIDPDLLNSIVLPSRKHILPIALAPPPPPRVS
ncbi:MAG: hypothetical protein DMD62_11925 [Gemmatimonadetes bacterium]|nr:MAG: hypothetical protein DMD62_11925 [Gemmatimonadota bacterium]